MRSTYWVWRRELAVMLRAPILYVIGGLFLVVQGIAFAGLVGTLSDPRRPAPLGALLEGQLAGTLLTWVLQLVVLTLLGMRTIADERRGGGWELLLTAQVSERAAVIGKWLAASTMYALLWIPTLAYLVVVAAFRSDGGGWDLGSIACGYAGAIAMGAALLAWAVAASAATSTTLAAGAAGFALLVAWFLVGELPSLWPDLDPSIAHILGAISLRARVTAFARGEIEMLGVAFIVALALVGLSLAVMLACAGRRRRREIHMRAFATLNLAVIGVLALVFASRHPHVLDVSAHRRNSLDPATVAVLAELPAPATLTIIEPTYGGLEPLYDEVARVADRIALAGRVSVRRVDPAALPGGLAAAARTAGLQPKDLASNGGVVVELAGRRRVVDVFELATIDLSAPTTNAIEQLAIEQALAGTLAELAAPAPITVCATTGHGELSLTEPDAKGADWTAVGNRLRGDGMTTVEVTPLGSFDRCTVVIVAGPIHELAADDALALQRFVAGGGGLLVAAAARPVPGGPELAATGLEGVLAAEGLALPFAIAIDPALTLRELPGTLMIATGYAAHPINAGFADKRRTLWFQPRVVGVTRGAHALISTTPAAWGETDLQNAPAKGDADLAGPVALAATGVHRVVALGSAESFSNATLAGGASAGDLWIEHAVRWLANRPAPAVDVAARTPDQVRLVMTSGERRAVVALSVAGIPLAWLVIGGVLVWWRRRA